MFDVIDRFFAPIQTIHHALERSEDGALGEGFFLDLLRQSFSGDEAQQQLEIAIDWGRYGELFEYNASTNEIGLSVPDQTASTG